MVWKMLQTFNLIFTALSLQFTLGVSDYCLLFQVSVPIVSNEKCKSMFLRAGRHEVIPDIFLCAGYDTGGQDSCQVGEINFCKNGGKVQQGGEI